MGRLIQGTWVVPASSSISGQILASSEPLSFWGGYDFHSGEIIDRRHPLSGQIAAGKILALPLSRGSSTTTAVLLEAVRAGTAPLAIVTTSIDTYFALASIVSEEMYAAPIPLITIQISDFTRLKTGSQVQIELSGKFVFTT